MESRHWTTLPENIMIYRQSLPSLFSLLLLLVAALFPSTAICSRISTTQLPYRIDNTEYYPIFSAKGFRQRGKASWYGPGFHGHRTSSGEIYNMHAMTAAHKILPMDTMLRVKNLDNGRETVVRVNDRGPFVGGRILDVSYAAAKALGLLRPGTARVAIYALTTNTPGESTSKPIAAQPSRQQKKGYYVQVGAFSRQSNALRLQQHFRNAGHKAIIEPATDPKKKRRYLVQVYVGKIYPRAQRAEKILLKKGYTGAFLLMRQ